MGRGGDMKRIRCSDCLPVRGHDGPIMLAWDRPLCPFIAHDGPIMLARDRPLCPFIAQACLVKIAAGYW